MRAAAEAFIQEEYYTYEQYAKWETGDTRYELIDGRAYAMAAPSVYHQNIIGELYLQLRIFLKGKPCRVIVSPVDVCLSGRGVRDDTVVQPDIIVVCDKSKLSDTRFINGAPDMAAEVISPSSSDMDRRIKYMKYRQHGVREYLIVDPVSKTVLVHKLKGGRYFVKRYSGGDILPIGVLPGCEIDLNYVFTEL